MLGALLGKRSKRPRDPHDAAIFDAEARVAVTGANLRDAEGRAKRAHAQLTKAQAAERAAVSRYDAVCLDSPDDAKALGGADATVKRTHGEMERARSAAVDADSALAAVQKAHAEAGEELGAARRAKEIAGLRSEASLERLREELRPLAERYLELEAEMVSTLAAMDGAHARSVAASSRLRELGEGVVDAAGLHLLAPFVIAHLAAEPGAVGDVLSRVEFLRDAVAPSVAQDGPQVGHLAQRRLRPALDALRKMPATSQGPDRDAELLGDLMAALAGRSFGEFHDILRARTRERREAASKAMWEGYKPPAGGGPHSGR